MSLERAMQRMLSPVARRLQNLLARGTVAQSDASRGLQTLQLRLLAGEVADGVEHFEAYGHTARPLAGAEHLTLFVDGDRIHGITVVVTDRRHRPKDLQPGESCLYDDQGQRVHITRDGIVVDGGGKAITFQNAPAVVFDVPDVQHLGKSIGKAHTHSGVQAGGANTGQVN